MWPETLTGCVCEQAGWCERHRCFKNAWLHLICRREQNIFEAFERGEGPCAPGTPEDVVHGASPSQEGSEPGLLRRAWNFSRAAARHVPPGHAHLNKLRRNVRRVTSRRGAGDRALMSK